MSHHHRTQNRPVNCYILTVSDTRTHETDKGGKEIKKQLKTGNHNIIGYSIVTDNPSNIKNLVLQEIEKEETEVIIITGGTGISHRDNTPEVITPLLDKILPGFGELFRMLSYHQIGSASILSRALAGICKNKIIFVIPGSVAAVDLAMKKLIIPELSHLKYELAKHKKI